MFAKYGVDMYFAGHSHSYSRSMPVANGNVDRACQQKSTSPHYHAANGTVNIVVGGAGCDEMQDVRGRVCCLVRSFPAVFVNDGFC